MDIQLYYTESGAGFPLILVHGNDDCSDYFKNQIPEFSKHFRVFAPDSRGHGRSPRGTAPFTLEQIAADLYDFMTERGLVKAHILGFSDGANIALLFALKHPEMVEKLIVNGADLSPRGVKTLVQLEVVAGFCLAAFLSLFNRKAVAKKEMLGLMVGQPDIKPEALGSLTMPTLVVAGDRDMIKDAHTRLIAASIPGAELVILAGSHFVAAESPAAFNQCALKFLLS